MRTYKISKGVPLYRYDLEEPPVEWSVEHYNPEYVYCNRKKNMFYGNFFFNSEYMARKTAQVAITRSKNFYEGAWITDCKLTTHLHLLDFTTYNFITEVLYDFYVSKIDVLNEEFTCDGCENSMSLINLRNIVELYCRTFSNLTAFQNDYFNSISKRCIKELENNYIDNSYVGFFLQRLSDFNNGISFKQLLQDNNYDGFIFNESNHLPGTDTICIFSPQYLTLPQKKFIHTDDL